ncbi:hypothetical protein V8F20_012862, partial [Naviculisporaceae sp. PSN 640]
FQVPYKRLYNWINGITSKNKVPISNLLLSNVEEKALYAWIDRFNRVNLVVMLEFLKNVVNLILYKKYPKSNLSPP